MPEIKPKSSSNTKINFDNPVFENIKSRRSIRTLDQKPLEKEIVEKIVQAGTYAPSSCNRQAWDFIIVDDEKTKERINKEAGFFYAKKIPTLVFILYESRFSEEKWANVQSATCAAQNMFLYAHSIGIGTWWCAAAGDEDKLREIMKIPKSKLIVSVLGFGYPAPKKILEPRRRPLHEVVHLNTFGKNTLGDIDKLTFEDVSGYRARSIYSISPEIQYQPYFPAEQTKVIEHLNEKIKSSKKVAIVYDFTGGYTYGLSEKNPDKEFTLISSSKGEMNWHAKRTQLLKRKNIKNSTEFKKKFDTVISLAPFNTFPNSKEISKNISKILSPKGKAYISFYNSLSFYGAYIKKGMFTRVGPEKPLTKSEFLQGTKASLKPLTSHGFNFFPSEQIITPRAGFEGALKMKKLKPLIRVVSLGGITEGLSTGVPLFKEFCREIVWEFEAISI